MNKSVHQSAVQILLPTITITTITITITIIIIIIAIITD